MRVNVKNTPAYPLRRWVVARLDEKGSLWFYGSWDDKSDAERVAAELGNGVVIENE